MPTEAEFIQKYNTKIKDIENDIKTINAENQRSSKDCCFHSRWNSKFCGTAGGIYGFGTKYHTDIQHHDPNRYRATLNRQASWTACQDNKLNQLQAELTQTHNDYAAKRNEMRLEEARNVWQIAAAEQQAIFDKQQIVREQEQIKINSEPLQILNEVQHIEPETIETPIQEKSFIDKNKNKIIIGGVAITALILILVVRK
tara:strand:- start:1230 stop:1829 length:600 start_codon:yes stop_codon:yes gene_type:complete